jgi:hypothetical protein
MSKDFQEKPSISHVEHVDSKQHSLNDLHGHNTVDLTEDHGDEHDPVFVKKTIRKIDIRLLIILGAMYSISLIDRTNLSSARLGGMATELKLLVSSLSIVKIIGCRLIGVRGTQNRRGTIQYSDSSLFPTL